MAYGGRNFPEGTIPDLGPSDITVIYRDLSSDVHGAVQRLLGSSAPNVEVISRLPDTPDLAARVLELSVGQTLPEYHTPGEGDPTVKIGETREVTERDLFVVAFTPYEITETKDQPFRRFATILQRAGVEAPIAL